jgi:anti-anti-sigma factor
MNYIVHKENGVVEMLMEGNDLQENVEIIKSRFNDLIDNGNVKIVVNMAQSNYVSSICLAVIVDIKKRLAERNGDIKIANVNRLIRNLFEITNLVKTFDLYENVDDAVEAFEE